jgi:hypothetical protein
MRDGHVIKSKLESVNQKDFLYLINYDAWNESSVIACRNRQRLWDIVDELCKGWRVRSSVANPPALLSPPDRKL